MSALSRPMRLDLPPASIANENIEEVYFGNYTTLVVISNFGGFSRCFFTAHRSAERISESRYFSGNPAGTWISRPIFSTIPVEGLWIIRSTMRMPSVGRLRCLQKPST